MGFLEILRKILLIESTPRVNQTQKASPNLHKQDTGLRKSEDEPAVNQQIHKDIEILRIKLVKFSDMYGDLENSFDQDEFLRRKGEPSSNPTWRSIEELSTLQIEAINTLEPLYTEAKSAFEQATNDIGANPKALIYENDLEILKVSRNTLQSYEKFCNMAYRNKRKAMALNQGQSQTIVYKGEVSGEFNEEIQDLLNNIQQAAPLIPQVGVLIAPLKKILQIGKRFPTANSSPQEVLLFESEMKPAIQNAIIVAEALFEIVPKDLKAELLSLTQSLKQLVAKMVA